MYLCVGLPSAVSRRAGGSNSEAGRAGEEDRTSCGGLQTVLGSPQSSKTGTVRYTHTHTHSEKRAGATLRSADRECEGRLIRGLAMRSLKSSAYIYLKLTQSRDVYF